jgi:hypothetical protein
MIDPKPKAAELGSQNAQSLGASPDPFDLATLRLDPLFLETAGVRKVLATVPVGKPSPQDFVRVHPGEEYRETFAVVDWKEDREFYVVVPAVAAELGGECVSVMLYTRITRQGVTRLWPIRLPGPDGRVNEWHRSQGEAAERAKDCWVRVKANTSLGAYEIFEASAAIAEPEWPTETYQQLIRIGFRDRIIDRLDHPIVAKLRGLA